MLHVRLREELDRLGQKPAAAARAAGEPDSQGLRDVLGGRKRLSADLLAALSSTIGVDALYVLTGHHAGPPTETLASDERELLTLYRAAPLAGKMAAAGALQGAMNANKTKAKQVFHGDVGQVVEGGVKNTQPVTFNVGGGKKKRE